MRVPRANILGTEGEGFSHMRKNLAVERLSIAVTSMARMRATFEQALSYSTERKAPNQSPRESIEQGKAVDMTSWVLDDESNRFVEQTIVRGR